MSITNQQAKEIRNAFLSDISPEQHFNLLFDHLPDIFFFVKNDKGQILFANEGLVRLYHFYSEGEFIGRTDFELLPNRLAEKYRTDDRKILESGQSMLNIIELFLNPQGVPEWYITNKLPVFSRSGRVTGVMGIIREYRGDARKNEQLPEIGAAVDFLKAHFRENVPVESLARQASLSVRQFERKFRAIFNTSPHQFMLKLRVHAACDLLRESKMPISDIATELGFTDQSALARHFMKNMGYTPLQYRKKFI